MANLISLMHLSFDGFTSGPGGEMDWLTHDQEIFEYISKYISKVGTGVYGPKTFQMMESHWPEVLKSAPSESLDGKHSRWYQGSKKVICSRSLKHLANKDARLISGNLEAEIKKLKQTSEKDLMVFGSPQLTQSLARLGLIDEYLVNVNPILIGGGVRMFEDLPKTKLELISSQSFSSGVVGFHYKKQS